VTNLQQQNQLTNLDGLFGHLSSCSGLYSKETFLSLYGCITRLIRDNDMQGFILTRTLNDDAFSPMAFALAGRPKVPLFQLDPPGATLPESAIHKDTGFLIALTNRFCATLYWSPQSLDAFGLYKGGWTFHPADTRTVVSQVLPYLEDPALEALLEATTIDRRYDDKVSVLITTLVNGLENQNRELTMALAQVNDLNKQVIEREQLAAIGQLCSVIAHEIRNPLGLISLYAKLIEGQLGKLDLPEGTEPEPLLKNLSLIQQATDSLEKILSELTSYSRPLTLEQAPIKIGELVEDICLFYEPSYREKEIDLQVSESNVNGMMLNVDAGRLRQALINLLKNALEATPRGSTVSVTVANRQNDPNLYIKVKDQGKGVDPKLAPKLFTPYFSTKGNGTGLGLAHSRKILQAHGGSVELLSSSPETGATFAIILPKSLAVEEALE
jgi:signal transduction histidine kinase